jgi:RNA polymerase sigma-70 factor, ECF subfamily
MGAANRVLNSPPSTEQQRVDRDVFDASLEGHRVELTGFCYRMLGSAFEAEDAVQETFVRAWLGYDRFEHPDAFKSWLYRIATNVCFSMLEGRRRRAFPMDLTAPSRGDEPLAPLLPEVTWLQPIPDSRVLAAQADPAETIVAQETIRLAFVAALQYLPPRQRAVLILRDVLRWRTVEVADLLQTTVVATKGLLRRARANLSERRPIAAEPSGLSPDQRALLGKYVDAFERYDIDELVSLLRDEATLSMPPHPMWLLGPDDIRRWWIKESSACRGSRLMRVTANGAPAYAQYRPETASGTLKAFAIHVVTCTDKAVTAIDLFLYPKLFALFGLPERISDG